MTKRRMPWIELACIAFIAVAWLATRVVPSTPRPQPQATTAAPDEVSAIPRTLSIRGIKLDMRREEVDTLFGVSSGTDGWRSYSERTGVSYGQDRVHVVMGTQLEKDGSPILREGDPADAVVAQLGQPKSRDWYGCTYVVERSILRVGLRPQNGYYKGEPEAADQRVGDFQLKRI